MKETVTQNYWQSSICHSWQINCLENYFVLLFQLVCVTSGEWTVFYILRCNYVEGVLVLLNQLLVKKHLKHCTSTSGVSIRPVVTDIKMWVVDLQCHTCTNFKSALCWVVCWSRNSTQNNFLLTVVRTCTVYM